MEPASLYLDRLPRATGRAFLQCTELKLFETAGWYLAGGTALALQVGHRQSVDLDFFTPKPSFSQEALVEALSETGAWGTTLQRKGTLYGIFYGAKISFIAYPFFKPSADKIRCGSVAILAPDDIAAMEIIAISQRGRKRDFVDLYWHCLNEEPLESAVDKAIRQYPGRMHNIPHFFKSLTYFADAESEPMPKMFFKASWREIKSFFRAEVVKISRKFFGLR